MDRHALDASGETPEIRLGAYASEAWRLLAPPGGRLHPQLADIVHLHACRRPDVDIFYGDLATGAGEATERLHRPDFDRTRLMAQDYLGLPLVVRAGVFHELGGLRPEAAAAASYDFVVRAVLAGFQVERIDEVLAAVDEAGAGASPAERSAVLGRAFDLHGLDLDVEPHTARHALRVAPRLREPPPVTLIVSLPASAGPDDSPTPTELEARLREVDWPSDRLHVVFARPGEASPPDALRELNALWRAGEDHLVFLDGDLVPRTRDWLAAMMAFAMEPDVGAVGGQAPGDGADGGERALRDFTGGAAGSLRVQHEVAFAPRAALACRRAVLEEVNGFDTRLAGAYADADLCLRMGRLAYRIVHTPDAAFGRAPRGGRPRSAPTPAPRGTALFLERWGPLLEARAARRPPWPPRAAEPGGWWRTGG